jgi:hypothetical protein
MLALALDVKVAPKSAWLDSDSIIGGTSEPLLATETFFRRLY